MPALRRRAPTRVDEAAEQALVVRWLRAREPRVLFMHPANGELRNIVVARRLKALGVSPGCPDLMIYSSPPRPPEGVSAPVGVAIEMKRAQVLGRAKGRLSAEQRGWLEALEGCGWLCRVCHGAVPAIELLRGLGY